MFIVSLKMSRKKIMIAVGTVVVLIMGVVFLFAGKSGSGVQPANTTAEGVRVESTEDIVTFLRNFGWEMEEEPAEIQQIAIPTKFNDVYESYNAIQKKQGYDLEKHYGVTAKRYSFVITNYPDNPDNVRANVLVYKDTVIGGDISSVEMDGFMHGFQPEEKQGENMEEN